MTPAIRECPWDAAAEVLCEAAPDPGPLRALDLAAALAPPFPCQAWVLRGRPPPPDRILPELSGSERETAEAAAAQPAHARGWAGWALSRLALRRAACGFGLRDLQVMKSASGAPRLPDPALSISLAHLRGLGAAALARDVPGIGLDLEFAARLGRPAPFLRQIASTAEIARLADHPPDVAAAVLWVLKEAAAKATGCGLNGRPESIPVADCSPAKGVARVLQGGAVCDARFRLFPGGAVALAWIAPAPTSRSTG